MLEAKSLVELRGLAQFLGIKLSWGWDRKKLIHTITEKCHQAGVDTPPEEKPRSAEQQKILNSLEKLRASGLVVTFPTSGSIRMSYTILREDTCHVTTPLKTVIECAKRVLNG